MGAALNPSMMLLGWQAQELEYKKGLERNLTQPAFVLPVMHAVGETAQVSVAMPGASLLGELSTVTIEARMSCQGSFDRDCDVWDHVHTLVRRAGCRGALRARLFLCGGAPLPIFLSCPLCWPCKKNSTYVPYRAAVSHLCHCQRGECSASRVFHTDKAARGCTHGPGRARRLPQRGAQWRQGHVHHPAPQPWLF